MNRIVIFALTMLVLASCSSMLLEQEAHESIPNEESSLPMTKSGMVKEADYDQSAVRYYFQTNRRILLMRHVEYRDSAYVQTLSEDEMRAFGITNEQKEFGNRYVVELNQINKHR